MIEQLLACTYDIPAFVAEAAKDGTDPDAGEVIASSLSPLDGLREQFVPGMGRDRADLSILEGVIETLELDGLFVNEVIHLMDGHDGGACRTYALKVGDGVDEVGTAYIRISWNVSYSYSNVMLRSWFRELEIDCSLV